MSKQAIEGAKRSTVFDENPFKLVVIGRDTADGPEHPRYRASAKLPDDHPDIQALAESFRLMGFGFGAITGHKNRSQNTIEVCPGNKRVIAARVVWREQEAAGLPESGRITVRVTVKQQSDMESLAIANAENNIRFDDSPLEKARLAKRLFDQSQSMEKTAAMCSVKVSTLDRWFAALECSAPVLKAIDKKQIGLTVAADLAKLDREAQVVELEKLIAAGPVTVAAAKRAVRKRKGSKRGSTHPIPPRWLLKKIAAANLAEKVVDPALVPIMKVLLGLGSTDRVKGLTGLCRELGWDPTDGSKIETK